MRNIVITGASTGIGYALVESFLAEGDRVWAGVRKIESLQPLQSRYSNLNILILDVTKSSDIEDSLKKMSNLAENEDFVLINNAGIAVGGPLEALPMTEWRGLFDINVFGLVEMTQKFLPLLRKHKGLVVNMGSLSGRLATPFLSPYTASKFAVRAISDALRRELRSYGVRVVLIEPGPIKTKIWGKALDKSGQLKKYLTPALSKVYGDVLDQLEYEVEQTALDAVPVDRVVEKVLAAVKSEKPCPYYPVGKNIGLILFLAQYFPTRILDRLLSRGFRFKRYLKK